MRQMRNSTSGRTNTGASAHARRRESASGGRVGARAARGGGGGTPAKKGAGQAGAEAPPAPRRRPTRRAAPKARRPRCCTLGRQTVGLSHTTKPWNPRQARSQDMPRAAVSTIVSDSVRFCSWWLCQSRGEAPTTPPAPRAAAQGRRGS
eukprot:4265681-Prymnesium_polylepis.2